MSGKVRAFFDTNIFVYSFDDRVPDKRVKARSLIAAALRDGTGVISFQVIQEFVNVATRKFAQPLSSSDCVLYLERVLAPLCEVHSSIDLYRDALDVQGRWRYGFFDSLIIAAALSAGCALLYTEDLQSGQKIRGLTVESPF